MTLTTLLRSLTPWGWALSLVGVFGAAMLSLHGLGFRWDPLGLADRRIRTAEARASVAEADATARQLEVKAGADQARRLDEIHQQTVAVARTTARVTMEARSAHDADIPLDPNRIDRLVRHDSELCRLAPDVCSAAAPDPAAGGSHALRAGAPAGSADSSGP